MTRADHDSISETRPVPEMLDYAAPPASKPVSFGAPIRNPRARRRRVCPVARPGHLDERCGDDAATGATTQALLQNFHRPGCCSFIYAVGSVNASALTDRHVVAYEPLQNHEGLGANFFYGDGHVEWHRKPEAADIVAKLHAGLNSPWQSATRPRD